MTPKSATHSGFLSEKQLIQTQAAVALLMLLLAIAGLLVYPQSAELSAGYSTEVLAFEFAKTESDLAFLSGDSAAAVSNRDQMDRGQQLDMVFPFAYAGLLALVLFGFARSGSKSAWAGVLFALAIIPADLYENYAMALITTALRADESAATLLPMLQTATWIKWGLIAFAIGLLAFNYFQHKRWLFATLAVVTASAIPLIRLLNCPPLLIELMMLLLSALLGLIALRTLWTFGRNLTTPSPTTT